MGQFVIACYRPRPGREQQLLQLVKEHLPTLRRQGLVTDRPSSVMRSADGTILEVFEWASEQAIERAHHDPVVAALWDRFGAVCDYVPLASLKEAGQPFPPFEPVSVLA